MIRSFILALALIGPTCAAAQDSGATKWRGLPNGWMINVDGDYCVAGLYYKNDEILLVSYEPAYNRATVAITSRISSSLQEGQRVDLYVTFVSGRNVDKSWGSPPFTVNKINGDSQLVGTFDGRDMLRDIARHDMIAFSVDGTADRLVGVYKLIGSAVAMDALRRCSFEAAGLDINDPFLR